MTRKFELGDEIKVTEPFDYDGIAFLEGATGKVVNIKGDSIGIEWNLYEYVLPEYGIGVELHDCDDYGEDGRCWNIASCYLDGLELVKISFKNLLGCGGKK